MVPKVWGQMGSPSGLGRISVQNLALRIHVLSHHTPPRASFHLKTRQEYFFNDQESIEMLKAGFGGTWFSTLFGTPYADFLREMGQNGVSDQVLLRSAPFLLQ